MEHQKKQGFYVEHIRGGASEQPSRHIFGPKFSIFYPVYRFYKKKVNISFRWVPFGSW